MKPDRINMVVYRRLEAIRDLCILDKPLHLIVAELRSLADTLHHINYPLTEVPSRAPST